MGRSWAESQVPEQLFDNCWVHHSSENTILRLRPLEFRRCRPISVVVQVCGFTGALPAHTQVLSPPRVDCGPNSAELRNWPCPAQIRPKSVRFWLHSVQLWPKSGEIGPSLVDIGPTLVQKESKVFPKCPNWVDVGPNLVDLGPCLPNSAKFGPTRSKIGRDRSKPGRTRTSLCEFGSTQPIVVDFGPNSAGTGTIWQTQSTKFGRIWSNLGQHRPICPRAAPNRPKIGQRRPEFGQFGPNTRQDRSIPTQRASGMVSDQCGVHWYCSGAAFVATRTAQVL